MEVSRVFEPGGLLSQSLEDYEPRSEQIKMAEAVSIAIDSCRMLVVEAGTGTGKTLAYLVPAILSDRQVVISTATKNLQEQVFFKDIPYLKKHLGVDFSAMMMKGRSNYLCPHRLDKFLQGSMFTNASEKRLLDKIFKWSQKTKTGDKAELLDLPEGSRLWSQICSTPDFCDGLKCPRQTDCFISKLRKQSEESQIIVVNHHLFFADLAIRDKGFTGVLPDYDVAIFDEAHQVEETASQYFGFSVTSHRMDDLVRDTVKEVDKLKSKGELIKDIDNLDTRIKNFFYGFHKESDNRFSLSEFPFDMESAEIVLTSLLAVESKLSSLKKSDDTLKALASRYLIIHDELARLIACEGSDYIFWGETRGKSVFLYASSIDVSPMLKKSLYSRCTTLFTSATLASAGEFDYFRSRLGLEETDTLLLPSPFDFEKQVSIYIPKLPEPSSAAFLDGLLDESLKVINLVKGKTLFLFTSFRNMHEVRRRLEGRLKFSILTQGEAPRHILLEQFRNDIDSVLLATSSFWQGVDVRGEALSCLIIDRLPFASPGDPVMSARIERIEKNGGNPFRDYQLPFAVLLLKQGLGRLIRHRNDKGIIMIADNRITTKRYGKSFLKSLPPAPIVSRFEELAWG